MSDKNFHKQPSEIERVGVGFGARLSTGEAVVSATYKIIDTSDDSDVTSTMQVTGSEQISDEDDDTVLESASIKVQAGEHGKNYKLTIKATTSQGLILEEDRIIFITEK
ncbi:MAG: hypothetical protein GY774_16575 [Planctomycetes bacterium]|nr:hypothetical protein [Planctomycetota bacterium]